MTNIRAKLSNKSKCIFPSNYAVAYAFQKHAKSRMFLYYNNFLYLIYQPKNDFGCGYTSVSARLEHWAINIPQWCLVLSTRIIFYCRKWAYHPLIVKQINNTIISNPVAIIRLKSYLRFTDSEACGHISPSACQRIYIRGHNWPEASLEVVDYS